VFLRDRNSGEGSFCLAFSDINCALNWCTETQRELLAVEWPEALLEHPGAAEEWGDTDDRYEFHSSVMSELTLKPTSCVGWCSRDCECEWECMWARPRWCAIR
jgi:hypothetical protein